MKNRIFTPFIAAFVLLVVVIILNRMTFNSMENYTQWVSHTRDVIISFNRLSDHVKSAEIYTPTYSDTTQRRFYQCYKNELDSVSSDIRQLRHLVNDNPEQERLVDTIDKLISQQLPTLAQKNIAEIMTSGEDWRIDILFRVHDLITKGIAHEQVLLDQRTADREKSTSLNNFLSLLLALFAVLIIVFTFVSNFLVQKKISGLKIFSNQSSIVRRMALFTTKQ